MRVSQLGRVRSQMILGCGCVSAAILLALALSSQIIHAPGNYHIPNIPSPVEPKPTPLPTPLPAYTPQEDNNEGEYAAIDQHALQAPPEAEKDVESLARYLVGTAHGDVQKARAIYRWITDRIAYDSAGFRSGNPPPGDPETTLSRRQAVCDGYSRLFKALATEAGLEVEIIAGTAKGYGFCPGQTAENHAWNAFCSDGQWHLVDSTWGAGHLSEGGDFEKEFSGFYFMTPPQQLVNSHFPNKSEWQMLSDPLNQNQFQGLPKLARAYFELGLELQSHRQEVIEAEGPVHVTLSGPQDLVMNAQLRTETGEILPQTTLVSRQGGTYAVDVAPPGRGNFRLIVFAAVSPGTTLAGVVEYALEVRNKPGEKPYPGTFANYTPRQVSLVAPRQGFFKAGSAERFDVNIPDASEAFVISGGQRNPMTKSGDEFSWEGRVKRGAVDVFAKFPEQNNYDAVLHYEAH